MLYKYNFSDFSNLKQIFDCMSEIKIATLNEWNVNESILKVWYEEAET